MAITIRRGDPCKLRFTPTNGMLLADLDEAGVAITQDMELIFFSEDDIVVDGDSITIEMSGEDTMLLVDGVETEIQAFFAPEEDQIIRFPIENITILPPAIGVR